jgi:hypothetical protein
VTIETMNVLQRVINVQPLSDEARKAFTHELPVALEALEEDEFVIVTLKYANLFVQFLCQGSFGMRIEAISNLYLPEDKHLSPEQSTRMLELGWNGPTALPDELEAGGMKADGSPNYFLDVARPVPYDVIAQLGTATLRDVFGAPHRGALEYQALGTGNLSIRFPNLGIRRQAK